MRDEKRRALPTHESLVESVESRNYQPEMCETFGQAFLSSDDDDLSQGAIRKLEKTRIVFLKRVVVKSLQKY